MLSTASLPVAAIPSPSIAETSDLTALGRELEAAQANERACYAECDRLRQDPRLKQYTELQRIRADAVDLLIARHLTQRLDWETKAGDVPLPAAIEDMRNNPPKGSSSALRLRAQEIVNASLDLEEIEAELGIPGADARADLAYEATGAVVDRIEVAPARSLEDLIVKVAAVRWCRTGDLDDDELAQAATDTRICHSILIDIATLGRV